MPSARKGFTRNIKTHAYQGASRHVFGLSCGHTEFRNAPAGAHWKSLLCHTCQNGGVSVLTVSETEIEETCTQFLEWDGWRSLKTDPVSRREWGKGFGEPGMADRLYIRYAPFDRPERVEYHPGANPFGFVRSEVMWIEWKRKGGKAEQHQKDWHTLERKRGALTLIAGVDFPAVIESFKEWYRASGLQRRQIS